MTDSIHLLDVVALTEAVPVRGLVRGQFGTVVEVLAPDTFEVEFADGHGRTYATAALKAEQLLLLRHQPAITA